ncbi:MAG: hypothetical protein N0C89_12210 [Candidatus Thiodiazotropha endolucinida]|nr:hypothetical protein [Candidatus Thiodiazotropha taylori]MCG8064894.1 hypothetical protein [Candidatus Thiodiazotropha taylori]MCG8094935.1 hypothetical protein [Candidatus Thiodiazotropha endolucinida]MCW4330985.1 hypothetical protein [Candidatus Thiodiazotropha endolucinida]MCW4343745.1 hypothetical protein [Candidatus Thiodiazotropha endolucinida]
MKRSTIIAYSVLFILALSLQGCGDNGGSSGNPPDIGGQFNKDPTAEYTAYSYAGGKTQTVINEDLSISAVSGIVQAVDENDYLFPMQPAGEFPTSSQPLRTIDFINCHDYVVITKSVTTNPINGVLFGMYPT